MSREPRYPIFTVWSKEDEAYLAIVPDLKGCTADGETRQEAIQNAEELIEEWLISAQNQGWNIPDPQSHSDIVAALNQDRLEERRHFERAVKQSVEEALSVIIPKVVDDLTKTGLGERSQDPMRSSSGYWSLAPRGFHPDAVRVE